MSEYLDYNNEEVTYEKHPDSREINVVQKIREEEALKSQIPKIDDDHVCKASLSSYVAALETELSSLKNANLVRDLKEMFSAGGEIIVGDDVDFETAIVIDKDVHLVLDSKEISISEDTVGDGVFHVTSGTLTIDGAGTINGVGKNDYNMAIWADGGNVVINSGVFTNAGATAEIDPAHFDLIYVKNGATVEINGGFFRCETPKWTLNKHDSSESSIVVKGGIFVNYDPSNSETEPGGAVSFVAEGYEVVSEVQESGEIWYTVVPQA